MERKCILIIDDEKEYCKLTKINLQGSGEFRVLEAGNGKEGIKLAKKFAPDLILLDIMMPRMDGFEVLQALKKDPKTMAIPVVMLTAKGDDLSKLQASRMYDEDYITKMEAPEVLKERIRNVFNRGTS